MTFETAILISNIYLAASFLPKDNSSKFSAILLGIIWLVAAVFIN